MKKTVFLLFTICLLMIQPLSASAFFDPIDAVKFAISFGEEIAIEAAEKIPIEIILEFFNNLEFDSNLVDVYHVLLTVIFESSPTDYSTILVAIPELQNYEMQRITEKTNKALEEFQMKYGNTLDNYSLESWKIIEQSAEKQIIATLSDEKEISELEKRRGLKDEITITAIEIIPVIDPETRQILPLKLVVVKSVDKIHFLRGSDFANDPTRTTALVILEPGFLLDVKMIQTADGKWVSIEEASTYGYKDTEIQRLKEIVDVIQGLSDLDDPTKIVENYNELHYLVNQINEEKEFLINN